MKKHDTGLGRRAWPETLLILGFAVRFAAAESRGASVRVVENGRFTAYYADQEKQVLLAPEGGAAAVGSAAHERGLGDGEPRP